MAFVTRNGKTKPVKNLGWILRHRYEVKDLKIFNNMTEFMLKGEVIYTCTWADKKVMRNWLRLHFPQIVADYRLDQAWERHLDDLDELESYIQVGGADQALSYIKNARHMLNLDRTIKW